VWFSHTHSDQSSTIDQHMGGHRRWPRDARTTLVGMNVLRLTEYNRLVPSAPDVVLLCSINALWRRNHRKCFAGGFWVRNHLRLLPWLSSASLSASLADGVSFSLSLGVSSPSLAGLRCRRCDGGRGDLCRRSTGKRCNVRNTPQPSHIRTYIHRCRGCGQPSQPHGTLSFVLKQDTMRAASLQ
jgi:hypothetical protein